MSKLVEIILAPQSRASFPHAMRECQILISWQAQHFEPSACRCNANFRDRRSTLELFEILRQAQRFRAFRAAFVAGAALSSLRADSVGGAALSLGRVALAACCGAVRIFRTQSEPSAGAPFRTQSEPSARFGRVGSLFLAVILRSQSEPSAHFGWVESILLWRGAHVEIAQ